MKRLFVMFALCLSLLAAFTSHVSPAKAAPLLATCQSLNGSAQPNPAEIGGGLVSYQPGERLLVILTAPAATSVTIGGSGAPGPVALPYTFDYALVPPAGWSFSIGNFIVTFTCVTAGKGGGSGTVVVPLCPIFFDGRLNNCDAGETAAVYCLKDGSVMVLAIWHSMGYAAILASPDQIATVPKNPTVNTAITSGNGATLYRLMSGELQVNRAEDGTGKMYHFTFQDCPKPQ